MIADNIVTKLHLQKVSDFSLPRKGLAPYHVAAYVPGAKVCTYHCMLKVNIDAKS